LNRWRSERCERTFAHACETGGGWRTWWRGLVNVTKVLVLKCAAFNLGLLLRKLFGLTKPRNAQGGAVAFCGPARTTPIVLGKSVLLNLLRSADAP